MRKNLPTLSRLGLLMDALDLSGKDLATALHVDDSLVSKWKNNHRPLALDSPYLCLIAKVLLDAEENRGTKIVDMLLAPLINENKPVTKATCIDYLCQWLTGYTTAEQIITTDKKNIDDLSSYSAQTHVWHGNKGRRKAVLMFLSQVLLMPSPVELLLVSQEPLNWLIEDDAFLNKWQELLMQVLYKGHKIQIIHSVDRTQSSLDSILEHWLPLHLTGRIRSWFYPVYGDLPYYLTLFIAKKNMVLSSLTPHHFSGPISTTLSHDPLSLSQYTSVFDSLVEKCQELIQVYAPPDLLDAIEKSNVSPAHIGDVYIFSRNLIFTTMSRKLLEEILRINKVTSMVSKRLLDCHNAYNAPCNSHVYYKLSDTEIVRYLNPGSLISHDLSRITKQEVLLSQEQRIRHVEHLMELMSNSVHFHLGLSKYDDSVELLIAQNKSVVAWSSLPELPQVGMVIEPTVVKALYEHFKLSWQAIPRVHRTNTEVIAMVKDHLSKVK